MATVTLLPNEDVYWGGTSTWDGVGFTSGMWEVMSDSSDSTYAMPTLDDGIVGFANNNAIQPSSISKIEVIARCHHNSLYNLIWTLLKPDGTPNAYYYLPAPVLAPTNFTLTYTDELTLNLFRSLSAVNGFRVEFGGFPIEGTPRIYQLSIIVTYDPNPVPTLGLGF